MGYIGQAEDEWEAEQRKKARKAKRASACPCPVCGKRLGDDQGLRMHARDVHGVKVERSVVPSYRVVETDEYRPPHHRVPTSAQERPQREAFTPADIRLMDSLRSVGYGWGAFASSVKRQGWISPKQRETMRTHWASLNEGPKLRRHSGRYEL